MYEGFFFVSNIHKGSVKGRNYFLYFSEIHIPDCKASA